MRWSPEIWLRREREHRLKLEPLVTPQLERRARGETHPVYDFLFEYYSFPPSHLLRWTPGMGVVLEGAAARQFLDDDAFGESEGGIALDPDKFPARRLNAARWILSLLEATTERAPRFGCFGLHEWAMVYRASEIRHRAWPLRVSPDELAAVVESQSVCCTHFDAFRFFTPAARPLNSVELQRTAQRDNDQRGCLHVNMDLYKWAFKFYPWISSDLIADAFLLARSIRELDMQASPYDLRSLGFEPVCIETATGRAEYQRRQLESSERSQALRVRLAAAYRALLAWAERPQTACLIP
jgi:hypothetical protein